MPPHVALLVFGSVIAGLLLLDSTRQPKPSAALWVPLLWLAILASKPVSTWFVPNVMAHSGGIEEGNPIDRTLLSLLMFVAASVLVRRRVHVGRLLSENRWIVVFFLYCAVSILWSEFPLVALKRWIRALGSVMVILVVLSEPEPVAAIAQLVRRVAYILVPVSILLIRYYRHLGVEYDRWTGMPFLVGASVNKNGLGRLCLVCGLFLLWDLIAMKDMRHTHSYRLNRCAVIGVLMTTLWLLVLSNSATSLVGFMASACVLLALGLPLFRQHLRYLGTFVLFSACMIAMVGWSHLVETVVAGLGRDMTFTTRTFIWNDLLSMGTNPLVGVGYDSFWLGNRLDEFVNRYRVSEAHNGYLEVYLELGMTGLCLMVGVILSVFRQAKRSLSHSLTFDYGRLRMAMLVVFVLYNVTEAAYKATTLVFFMLLVVAIDVPMGFRAGERRSGATWRTKRLSVRGRGRDGRTCQHELARGTEASVNRG